MTAGPMRPLFVIAASKDEEICRRLEKFRPTVLEVSTIKANGGSLDREMDGSALIIAASELPNGVVSGLTRFLDFPFLYLLDHDEPVEVARFWFHLGAEYVLSRKCPDAVLEATIEEMVTIEPQSILSRLTKRETAILEHLKKAGRMGLKRGEIAERVWGKSSITEKNVDVHIFNLRRKLNGSQLRIENHEGCFRLVERTAD